jgi:hypothetical protein
MVQGYHEQKVSKILSQKTNLKKKQKVWGTAQVAKLLLSKCEALHSFPSTEHTY